MSSDQLTSIQVHCIPDNHHAVIGVLNSKRARFEIQTKKNEDNAEASKRVPLNLVLVLDRSGSMASKNKFEFAKQAVISVLSLLHDDDIIHLVAYDDNVWTVFENARASARRVLYSVVQGLQTGGQTNLSGGMETGADLLEKYSCPGFSKRMFVLSDGLANVGIRSTDEIMKVVTQYSDKGIVINSFGVGEDFDEKMMKSIAEAGCGQFYFLESAEVIVPLMTKALQSVFDVFGAQAQLIVRGRNNTIVTKIWGYENIASGASLGDLHFDNRRVILCDFTVSGTVPQDTQVDVLEYQLKYNRPGSIDEESLVVTGTLSVTFVHDATLIQEIDPRVRTLYAVQVAAEMDDKIAQLITDNKRDNAITLIAEQITLLKEVEHLDDEKRMIAMLIRMAENMQKRLQDKAVSEKTAAKYYGHHGHMKKCHSDKYTHDYAD